jgi:hypothetical protein
MSRCSYQARGGQLRFVTGILRLRGLFQVLAISHRVSPGSAEAQMLEGSKSINSLKKSVDLSPLVKENDLPTKAFDLHPKLEAALACFEEGSRRSRGGLREACDALMAMGQFLSKATSTFIVLGRLDIF